ncbi:MAG: M4 family metallopeptidase [Silvanigrellaceae bacterium]
MKLLLPLVFIPLSFSATTGCSLGSGESRDPQPGFSRHVPLNSSEGKSQQQRAELKVRKEQSALPSDADHQFKAFDLIIDQDGTEHTRFNRTYKGLKVVGGDVVVHHQPRAGQTSLDVASAKSIEIDPNPLIELEQAKVLGRNGFKGKPVQFVSAELTVLNTGTSPKLTWQINFTGFTPEQRYTEQAVYVDAENGSVLAAWETIYSVAVSGKSFYSGDVTIEATMVNGSYQLNDQTRGGLRTHNMNNAVTGPGTIFNALTTVFGNNSLTNATTIGVDAHFGAAMTWDYFLKVHKRNGIKNDGVGSVSRVHFDNSLNNAFWSDQCFCMTYGDGDGQVFSPLTSLDVAGHEMTHGITSNSAGLIYSGESGGLNEATSDIFGSMVEYYANRKEDPPDYTMGEKIALNPPIGMRYMYDPKLDGRSKNCWTADIGTIDVHFSSGVGNHFFYLLAEGSAPAAPLKPSPTCDNSTVVGIGRDKAAQIWYRALTVYMTSSTDYAAARVATLKASLDLFGAASTETKTVNAAWNAVTVLNTQSPTISAVQDQTTNEDTEKSGIVFTISDGDSPLSCKDSVTAKSSNSSLIANSKVVSSGSGTSCVLSLTPEANASGNAQITLIVSDGQLTAETTFSLNVAPVNDLPQIDVNDQSVVIAANGKTTIPVIVNDVDSKVDCASQVKVTLTGTSSAAADGFAVSGTAPVCLVTINAKGGPGDSVTLKIEVSDGGVSSSKDVQVSLADVAAVIITDSVVGKAPFWLKLDGSNSVATSGKISEWVWSFGDGTSGKAREFWKSYTKAGTYNVSLRAVDDGGKSHETTIQVQVE